MSVNPGATGGAQTKEAKDEKNKIAFEAHAASLQQNYAAMSGWRDGSFRFDDHAISRSSHNY
ncbi:MAG: hypothetical protein ACO1QB_04835 [Verrucomicrobiales bacterium]